MKRVFQVLSSFTSIPLRPQMESALRAADVCDELVFVQYDQMTTGMLGLWPESEQIMGTLILLRVEDWLRGSVSAENEKGTVTETNRIRECLRARTNEFVSHIESVSRKGLPILVLVCPSNGWIASNYKLGVVCQTYSNLILVRIQSLANVKILVWPSSLGASGPDDHSMDRLSQVPFTAEAFEQLAQYLEVHIRNVLKDRGKTSQAPSRGDLAALVSYLRNLCVHVHVAPADSSDREHLDRVVRTAAGFSLNGERAYIADAEIDSLVQNGLTLIVSVSDRFSNRIVGGFIVLRPEEGSLVMEMMALTCPVLGKQVEHAVASALVHIAKDMECVTMRFEYCASGRNEAMLAFLKSICEASPDGGYVLAVEDAQARIRTAAVAWDAWTLELEPIRVSAVGA